MRSFGFGKYDNTKAKTLYNTIEIVNNGKKDKKGLKSKYKLEN